MKISNAIELDKKTRRGIARRAWSGSSIYVVPTNTDAFMILRDRTGERSPKRGWQPSADDLTANDWYVNGSQKFYKRVNSRFYTIFKTILHFCNSFSR
ncbi:DUF2829 domain-containing protein [Lacticaseibacillus paracasei]|uniref:DUF2829 domain-containing protein n=1 Tax=Lacticaseibacillus paracasei TaxID=1597 RepID=A0ABD7BRD8_LACPA|nr:DUF2829 domain-containing protein [Lacticaseibacillus paracasei]QPB56474.1 DUF2829 domain-containing protein [Lacticaseibacillus paracasei]